MCFRSRCGLDFDACRVFKPREWGRGMLERFSVRRQRGRNLAAYLGVHQHHREHYGELRFDR